MIDTHAHIYDEAFDPDRAEVVARARTVGVFTPPAWTRSITGKDSNW